MSWLTLIYISVFSFQQLIISIDATTYGNVNCISVTGSISGGNEGDTSTAVCSNGYTMTSCGIRTADTSTQRMDGSFITHDNAANYDICHAQNGQSSPNGVYAIARCCDFSAFNINCNTYTSGESSTSDDDLESQSCLITEELMGCTLKTDSGISDGAFPGSTKFWDKKNQLLDTENMCSGKVGKGASSGLYAVATCCVSTYSNVAMSCYQIRGIESSEGTGSTSTIQCPSNYFMTGCSGFSRWISTNQWEIDSNNICRVRQGASSEKTTNAAAICCQIDVTPTAQPTNNPIAGTFNPIPSTTNPTPSPTSNPTPSPTTNPTPSPTTNPTPSPTTNPALSPTANPTPSPTTNPTLSPTLNPTPSPTSNPTQIPSKHPTTSSPTSITTSPTVSTSAPTSNTKPPTISMTASPTTATTIDLTTALPMNSMQPTSNPTTLTPTTASPNIAAPTFSTISATVSATTSVIISATIPATTSAKTSLISYSRETNNNEDTVTLILLIIGLAIIICCCMPLCCCISIKLRQSQKGDDNKTIDSNKFIINRNMSNIKKKPVMVAASSNLKVDMNNIDMVDVDIDAMETGGKSGIQSEASNITVTPYSLTVDGHKHLAEIENVKNWITFQVELPQYFDILIDNGYDSLNIIKVITKKEELKDIGIILVGHQTLIMSEIKKLKMETDE